MKKIVLFVCLLATATLLRAFNPDPTERAASAAEYSCNLPAPSNFRIQAVGPNWMTFAWDPPVFPASPLTPVRVRVFRASDNALLSTTTVPAGNLGVQVSIPEETDVYGIANSICQNGEHGPNSDPTPIGRGVILELIVDGYTGSGNNVPGCNFVDVGGCEFSGVELHTFRIGKYNSTGNLQTSEKFAIKLVNGSSSPDFEIHLKETNNNNTDGNYNFYCGTASPNPTCSTIFVTIKEVKNGIEFPAGSITASYNLATTFSTLSGTLITNRDNNGVIISQYKIHEMLPGGEFAKDSDKAEEQTERTDAIIQATTTVTPNPFNDQLDISLNEPGQENTGIRLYNLNGQLLTETILDAETTQVSLSTAHIAPGFYLLRIENAGKVQTFKLVKS